jgi:hypothetical protein
MLKNFGLLDNEGSIKNPAQANYDINKFFTSLKNENLKVLKKKKKFEKSEGIQPKMELVNSGIRAMEMPTQTHTFEDEGEQGKYEYGFVKENIVQTKKPKVRK